MSTTMTTEDMFGELVPLGQGPAATVLAGVRATGEAFALKVYPGRIDRRTQAQLTRELGALTALRERVPVLVADAIEDLPDGRFALRMELCAQSLTELVSSFGPMSVPDALALGESLAAALAAAHGAGILHGGVTPGNVLFRPSGEAVLSDFGLTLRRAFPPDVERVVDYLPPETVRDGSADEGSDLYGLGAVLHLALAGYPPHAGQPGEREGERVLRVLGAAPVPPLARPGVPPGLTHLVSALLAKNPDARPIDAATVAARLGALSGSASPAQDHAFDDFSDFSDAGGCPAPAPAPAPAQGHRPPAPPPPLGTPILEYGPGDKPKRPVRTGLVLAALAALAVLATAVVLLLVNDPEEVAVPPATAGTATPNATSAPATPSVQLELLEPADRGNYVELTWRSSEPLDFAISVAEEGKDARTMFVQRNTTYRLPVDPVLKYCFRIQGANSNGVYESQPKPIREAICTG